MMLDRYLASKPSDGVVIGKREDQEIRDLMLVAKRFILDVEAALYVGEIVAEIPEWIAENQDLVIPPFRTMYIEVPFREYQTKATGQRPDDQSDITVGYLFHDSNVYVVSEAMDGVPPVVLPISYALNSPFYPEDEREIADALSVSRGQLDAFFWGESYLQLDDPRRRSLRARHSVNMLQGGSRIDKSARKAIWNRMYDSSSGDLRTIVALLQLFNRTASIRYEDVVAPSRGFIKAKQRTFLSHSVIRFKINPKETVKRPPTDGEPGFKRAEHEVRGHFCLSRQARENDCVHTFVEDLEAKSLTKQWRCVRCSAKKWWRRDHKRGDASLGTTKPTYVVDKT